MLGGLRDGFGGVRQPSHEGSKSLWEFIIGLTEGESWKYWRQGKDLVRLTFWKVIHILRAERGDQLRGNFYCPILSCEHVCCSFTTYLLSTY